MFVAPWTSPVAGQASGLAISLVVQVALNGIQIPVDEVDDLFLVIRRIRPRDIARALHATEVVLGQPFVLIVGRTPQGGQMRQFVITALHRILVHQPFRPYVRGADIDRPGLEGEGVIP